MISSELLEIICCPETHQDLELVSSQVIERVNAKIAAGGVTTRGGAAVADPIDGGLLRADREYLYVIREEIPVLLIDEALPFGSLTD